MVDDEILATINEAIWDGDQNRLSALLDQHPDVISFCDDLGTLLHEAAATANLCTVELLLEAGADVNAGTKCSGPPITTPIHRGYLDVVKCLLEHGADPKLGWTLISALNCDDPRAGNEIAKLLVEHGVDINRVYYPFDDQEKPPFTALSRALELGRTEIADYLRSQGAVMPPPQAPRPARTASEEVVQFFKDRWQTVQPQALQEIVPAGLPISIHVARSKSEDFNRIALFTTGMSEEPMNVPPGYEKLRYAELTMQLPGDWPLDMESLQNPDHRWPFDWLKNMARYPHAKNTWLGGPAVIISNGEPPGRLSRHTPFTALLLMIGEEGVTCQDGREIQIYHVMPLYPEERDMERAKGISALLEALDRHSIERVVDLNRANVAL